MSVQTPTQTPTETPTATSTAPVVYLPRLVRRAMACTSGVAAVEFGMIVPIMFMLFVGSIEFSQAITIDRRVTQVASSTADLVSRQTTVTSTQLAGFTRIIDQLIAPYPLPRFTLSLLSVYMPAGGTSPLVCWHYPHPVNGAANAHTAGQTYTLPNGSAMPANVLTAGTSVIVAEAKYDWQPVLFRYFITSNILLTETFFLKPRLSTEVVKDTTKCF